MGDSHQSKEENVITYDRSIHKVEKVLDKITRRTVEYRVKLVGIDELVDTLLKNVYVYKRLF